MHQHTLLNLGSSFSLPREQWSKLATRIQEVINGQEPLFEAPQEVEELAQNYAAQLIQAKKKTSEPKEPDYCQVNVDSMEVIRPRSISCEHVALEAFNALGLGEHLKKIGFNGQQLAAATGSIIGRMCRPASERATLHWLQNMSGSGELIDYDFGKMNLYKMRLGSSFAHYW